jgi:hypothetical protein
MLTYPRRAAMSQDDPAPQAWRKDAAPMWAGALIERSLWGWTMTVSAVHSGTTSSQLVKLANGEYTAASVTADPKDATKLGLVKEKDGNYGTTPPAATNPKSSTAVLSSLATMKLGGD